MTASHSIFDLISPLDLGLPSKFSKFRLQQREALDWAYNDCSHALTAALIQTGGGKTAFAVALSRLLGVKTVYLVATKALQQQVLNDFSSIGMTDVRGRANYTCSNYGNCDKGYDQSCSLSETMACPYRTAVDTASRASLTITNYAYWLHSGGTKNRAFADTGLLICDEFHAAEAQLSGYASVKLYSSELGREAHLWSRSGTMGEDEAESWRSWAQGHVYELSSTQDEDEKDLLDRLVRVTKMKHANWVWQFDDRGHVTFEPVRLAQFTRSLFSGVPRVLMMSATLNEFTLKLLLPSDVEYDYRVWGSVFPPQNAPVYHIPCRKLNWKSTDEDYKAIIETADNIINSRTDRKGIVHTVSYARTKRALQHSIHTHRFIWNEDGSTLPRTLSRFRDAPPGSLLVTPSVEEGFDFPGAEAEYQIILKFPFPNETNRVIKERCAQIPGYRLHYAAQKVVQMRGRAVRSETDRAETFILDNSVRQLTGAEGRSYCPPGFRIFTVAQIPKAPPKIVST